jgi:hypothetical protein
VLVVPGNHDVAWLEKTGDRLRRFERQLSPTGYSTVYGGGPRGGRRRYRIPDAVIDWREEYGIAFHLLASCFYDGELPLETREFLNSLPRYDGIDWRKPWKSDPKKVKKAWKAWLAHERLSGGVMPITYRARVEASARAHQLSKDTGPVFAVMHHPPLAIGRFPDGFTGGGGALVRQRLLARGYSAILCGHNHSVDQSVGPTARHVDVIPSGSLSGLTDQEPNCFLAIDVYKDDVGSGYCIHRVHFDQGSGWCWKPWYADLWHVLPPPKANGE